MKTAVCLYGLFTHHFPDSGEMGHEHIKERILKKVPDADFFCHSWDVNKTQLITDWYQPKKWVIEPQIDFSEKVNAIDLERYLYSPYRDWQYLFRAFSFYYTRAKAIELKKEYEKENNFKYDCVIDSRFDLAWNNPIDFSNYNMDNFYIPTVQKDGRWYGWPHTDQHEIMDFVFFSNSDNMNDFSPLIYDMLGEYNKTIYQWKGMSAHFVCFAHLVNLKLLPDKCRVGLKIATPNGDGKMKDDDHCQLIRREYFGETLRR